MKNVILKTEQLCIGYRQKKGEKIIAKNINLSIKKGKFIALLGKNGVGKSTLLRTIANIQTPLNGSLFFNNQCVSKYTNKELSTLLSFVLTEHLPESQLTVFELIALGRQPYTNWIDTLTKKDIEKVYWAMNKIKITSLKNNRFYELSDGQLQCALIARALAQDTAIIILDEPSVHLDMHHTLTIFSLLKNLVKSTQKTIIISTHQVNLALQLADELIVLSENKIYTGTKQELINQNALDTLFCSELIHFDQISQQFIIK